MSPSSAAFWTFLVLTVVFALVFLWRLMPRAPAPAQPSLAVHTAALLATAPTGADAASIKTIADAIAGILNALGSFGSKLDTLGPTALLGIFTVFFALLTLACAWLPHT